MIKIFESDQEEQINSFLIKNKGKIVSYSPKIIVEYELDDIVNLKRFRHAYANLKGIEFEFSGIDTKTDFVTDDGFLKNDIEFVNGLFIAVEVYMSNNQILAINSHGDCLDIVLDKNGIFCKYNDTILDIYELVCGGGWATRLDCNKFYYERHIKKHELAMDICKKHIKNNDWGKFNRIIKEDLFNLLESCEFPEVSYIHLKHNRHKDKHSKIIDAISKLETFVEEKHGDIKVVDNILAYGKFQDEKHDINYFDFLCSKLDGEEYPHRNPSSIIHEILEELKYLDCTPISQHSKHIFNYEFEKEMKIREIDSRLESSNNIKEGILEGSKNVSYTLKEHAEKTFKGLKLQGALIGTSIMALSQSVDDHSKTIDRM